MTPPTPASLHAVALALVVAVGCGPYEDEIPGPASPCLPLPEGARYHVTLVERYDAASQFYFDPSRTELSSQSWGCTVDDGLGPGSVVAFTTGRYSPAYNQPDCSYREMTDVEGPAVHAGHYRSPLVGVPQVTAAAWTREAILGDEMIEYTLTLLAPTGDLMAEPVPGGLPSALLARSTRWDGCAEVWVAVVSEVVP